MFFCEIVPKCAKLSFKKIVTSILVGFTHEVGVKKCVLNTISRTPQILVFLFGYASDGVYATELRPHPMLLGVKLFP